MSPDNCFLQGSCTELLKTMDDGFVDLVCFSPPYDSVRTYNGFQLDLHELGKELFRVLKDGGVCVVVIGDQTKDFAKSLTTARLTIDWVDNVGFRLFEQCVYKRHGKPGNFWNQRFRVDHESILIFAKTKPKYFDKKHMEVECKYQNAIWHGTERLTDGSLQKVTPKKVNTHKCRGTVWEYSTSNSEGNPLKMQHPATFPQQLAEDVIRCFSAPNDIVLDPTVGSGSTCIAAAQYGRRWIGIDISPEYIEICNKRMASEFTESIL